MFDHSTETLVALRTRCIGARLWSTVGTVPQLPLGKAYLYDLNIICIGPHTVHAGSFTVLRDVDVSRQCRSFSVRLPREILVVACKTRTTQAIPIVTGPNRNGFPSELTPVIHSAYALSRGAHPDWSLLRFESKVITDKPRRVTHTRCQKGGNERVHTFGQRSARKASHHPKACVGVDVHACRSLQHPRIPASGSSFPPLGRSRLMGHSKRCILFS